jgi:hypothetical protein
LKVRGIVLLTTRYLAVNEIRNEGRRKAQKAIPPEKRIIKEEAKQKLRESNLGKKRTPEQVENIKRASKLRETNKKTNTVQRSLWD